MNAMLPLGIVWRWDVSMMLFDMTDGVLLRVDQTTFAAERVLERAHLQVAIRDNIAILGDDLLVVAEEFGEFEGANRRIDLLCLDREAHLVVVELKRTGDGGRMELQAMRYAAMVSTMTFDDLVTAYERHLQKLEAEADDVDAARSVLIDWVEDLDNDEPVLSQEVRLILASAGFSREVTTTVLWLNDVYGTDIRCVRLTPYRHEGRLLLDVQQVVPLPEAEEFTIRLKKRVAAARVASSGRDLTRYSIVSPHETTPPLPKRRAVLAVIHALHQGGVRAADINAVIKGPRFLSVDGELEGEALTSAFVIAHPKAEKRIRRWFIDEPLHESGRTWVLSKMWGAETEEVLGELIALAPSGGFDYSAAGR
jgi:hypothetical protein